MSTKTIATILNLKDNFSKGIKSAANSTKTFQRQIKQAENQASKMRKGIAGAFTGTAAKITGLLGGIGLVSFAKDSLMLASDLNEVQNVVDTTFGSMSSKINDFAKTTSSKFGISELQAKKYSGTLGAMMKSSGISADKLGDMSTALAGLSGDMASFYNLDPDEAFEKLKSAISGETEPMKALGVNMSVANMEAYALSKGVNKSWKSMTQAEQTTLRYNYLLENTKDSQGDYLKTNKTFANSLRTLKLNFQTLGAKIMSNFIPVFEDLFNKINDFITKIDIEKWTNKAKNGFNTLKNAMKYLIPAITGVAAGLLSFMAITKVMSLFTKLKSVVKGTTTIFKAFNLTLLANPITWIAIGIGLLVAGLVLLYKKCVPFRNFVDKMFAGLVKWIKETILPILKEIGKSLLNFWNSVLVPFGKWLSETFGPAFKAVFEIIGSVVGPIFKTIGDYIENSLKIFKGLIDFLTGVFTGDWDLAWQGIKEIVVGTIDKITDLWNDLKDLIQAPIKAVVNIEKKVYGDDKGWNPLTGVAGMIGKNAIGTNYYKGGYTWVGERGPELMKLPGGTQIKTNSQSNKMVNGNSNLPSIQVIIQGNVIGNESFINQVGNAIYSKVSLALVNSKGV